jgi:hypothetical protein
MKPQENRRFYPVLERPVKGGEIADARGAALARVIEWHPELSALLDFYDADPQQIAREVGMLTAYDDPEEDLEGVDLGGHEWFEAQAGLVAVRKALEAVRNDPASIRRAIYEPDIGAADIIADLESIESLLESARQQETRFYFALEP